MSGRILIENQERTSPSYNYPLTQPWSSIVKDIAKRGDSGPTDVVLVVKNELEDKEERFPVLSAWLTLRSPGLDEAIEDKGPNCEELFLPSVKPHILRHALHVSAYSSKKTLLIWVAFDNWLTFLAVHQDRTLGKTN